MFEKQINKQTNKTQSQRNVAFPPGFLFPGIFLAEFLSRGRKGQLDTWSPCVKSKTAVSLTNSSKLIFRKLPPNSSNAVEILYQGCFIFSICPFILESCWGHCGRRLDVSLKRYDTWKNQLQTDNYSYFLMSFSETRVA